MSIAWILRLLLTWILCLGLVHTKLMRKGFTFLKNFIPFQRFPCSNMEIRPKGSNLEEIVWWLPSLHGHSLGPRGPIDLYSFSSSWCWAFEFLKKFISDQSYGCLKMDWQKVSLKPQFWYKCDGYLLWTVITWTPEVQLTWILFLWQGRFQALVMGTEFKVLTWKDTSEPLFEKLRQYFGFHCFCFPCQDFGRFLLNTSLLHL